MKNCKTNNIVTRALDEMDGLQYVFDLCKENSMTTANYASSKDIWDFQYNKNPIGKSWNAVIADDDLILGHIGLYPLPICTPSGQLLAGSISNGVLSKSIRNKMVAYKDKKTFAVVPLIDTCCNTAFGDGASIIFVHSSIHSLIWKTLKFTTIEMETTSTFHSGFKDLYLANSRLVAEKNIPFFKGVIGKLYSVALTAIDAVPKLFNQVQYGLRKINTVTKNISSFEYFDNDIDVFFKKFHLLNKDIITYKRDKIYLNWKFSQRRFKKFKICIDNEIIGYIVLEPNNNDEYKVVDFLVLNQYLNETGNLLDYLVYTENLAFIFPHYLSSKYAKDIHTKSNKCGISLSINPLSKFNKEKKCSMVPLYYKLNDFNFSAEHASTFKTQSWFITPIFFTPTYSI